MADDYTQRRARAAYLARLLDVLVERGGDELAVLEGMALGLIAGLGSYGPLDLDTDRREWDREIDQERRDELVYRACKREADRRATAAARLAAIDETAPTSGDQ